METFSVVVIGGGPGGYPAAIRAAQLGASVALVEKEELGGCCLNWGCIPSKTLMASAELYAQLKVAATWGLKADQLEFDYGGMNERKDKVVGTLRNGIEQLLASNNVRVFMGTASFLSRNRIAVNPSLPGGAAPTVIGAEKTIIATGAVSAVPGFLPQHPRIIESRAFFQLKALPPRAVILGGGVIGCEMACLLARLDVQVTVVELLEDILSPLDADVRRAVRRHMEKDLRIRILTGVTLEEVTANDEKVTGRAGREVVDADLLLVALGRKPVTQDLKPENAGLGTRPDGFIEVDAYGRAEVATIYAVGDVTGGPQLAHAATSQGLVAAENACTRRLRKNEKHVPCCIFTSPEVGTVGLTEQEARQKGLAVKTGKYMFGVLGKALAMGQASGFVKWVADASTGQLLGAHAVGPHATELIAEATVAIRAELTADELARTVHAHPTLAEAWAESAHVLLGEPIHTVVKGMPKR